MSSPNGTTNLPAEVTIPLDFEQYLSTFSPAPDGEFDRHPTTFEEIIAERVAHIVAQRVTSDTERYSTLRRRIEDRVGELIAERVDARITAVLEEPRQPTDAFGNAKGDPTTLNEIILQRVDDHLRKMTGDNYGSRQQMTRLDRLASEAIDRKWDAEVRKSIEEASLEVRQKITARAAEVLTESIKAVTR